MNLDSVIFDMDGLLIDSEPFWQEAGTVILNDYGISLTEEQHHNSTGLRTNEWVKHWFNHFGVDKKNTSKAARLIEEFAIEKIKKEGQALPGVHFIMRFFKERNFKIGIASSSPVKLIETVLDKLEIRPYLTVFASAESLQWGKPHPRVFLNCAKALNSNAVQCICFEDSFNGMIAAKAARMKCVIIPAPHLHHETKWDAADIKLSSLLNFSEQMLVSLEN
jgi:HAD superfamily hydrolase (TIGR01509 family)